MNLTDKQVKQFKSANRRYKIILADRWGIPIYDIVKRYYNRKPTFLNKKKKVFTEPTVNKDNTNIPTDIVIAFDTTGSMSSYIAAVRRHVTELIPTLFENTNNLKIKIVAFGDYCDMRDSTTFGNAYQETELTNDSDVLINFVKRARNTRGGDSDEFYELVIKKITEETPWRDNSNRSILLIGDCNPHRVGYNYHNIVRNAQIDWKEEALKAKSLGIKIDTLAINEYITWYKEVAEMTGGLYLLFKTSNNTSQLLKGYSYSRSGATEAFAATKSVVMDSDDEELKGVYRQLGEL